MTGSNSDAQTDGGNLASREDVVTVQITYRLGNLGFLAIPGTSIKGNFGIADQVNALEVRSSTDTESCSESFPNLKWPILTYM